ncbi:MAG TPA: ATP-binding protein [Steroidobacteraceae bacterium]|jgi:hypothetical protein|nr:ATP-binding protein [Steroidobacteraceae bacterium]
MKLRILHLDDNPDDHELVRLALARAGLHCDIEAVSNRDGYVSALEREPFDVIISDSGIPGYDGNAAMSAARDSRPATPFIVVSGGVDPRIAPEPEDHACARLPKTELSRLASVIDTVRRRAPKGATRPLSIASAAAPAPRIDAPPSGPAAGAAAGPSDGAHVAGMKHLVDAVQQLSLARDLQTVMDIVRHAARRLAGSDGATFVLRDGDRCFYAEEDAISPLWKGQRFPLSACISGWAMLNRRAAIIPDIYQDSRIPHDAYRPTFVKSLMMTPIRTSAPIGAIGVYWARNHEATHEEIELLRALADSTCVAIESVDLLENLEKRVAERTREVRESSAELEVLNQELEAFCHSAAHDLRPPLSTIDGFTQALLEDSRGSLDDAGRAHLGRITGAVERMQALIGDLLTLSRIVRLPMNPVQVDLSQMAREIIDGHRTASPERKVEVSIPGGLAAEADAGLLRIVLENLLSNAWKYSSKTEAARIEVGTESDAAGRKSYFVRDNGAGFDSQCASKLFSPFQRLHTQSQFPGTGVGLSTVKRIVHRHGGKIWATADIGKGACFQFTLGPAPGSLRSC